MTTVYKQGQEHGPLGSLGSPVLSKIREAFRLLKGSAAAQPYTASQTLKGLNNAALFVGWNQKESLLVLTSLSGSLDICEVMRQCPEMVAPSWLAPLAPQALVLPMAMHLLDTYLCVCPQGGSLGLSDTVYAMTGNTAPRRVICVGYCVGGAVATLAAAWAGVQWPTADVRCISFGAPAVGNAAFAAAFRWLVGISYRVVFRRDPVPAQSVVSSQAWPRHVHGAVYLVAECIKPGLQPKINLGQQDISEHDLAHYSGAVSANCQRQLARQKSSGGVCRARLDKQCVLSCRKDKVQPAATELPQRRSPTPDTPSSLPRSDSLDEEAAEDAELAGESRIGMMPFLASGIQHIILDSATVSKNAVLSAVAGLRKGTDGKVSQTEPVEAPNNVTTSPEGRKGTDNLPANHMLLPPDDLFGNLDEEDDEQMCQIYNSVIEAAQPPVQATPRITALQIAKLKAEAAAVQHASANSTADVQPQAAPAAPAEADNNPASVASAGAVTSGGVSSMRQAPGPNSGLPHDPGLDRASLQAAVAKQPPALIPDQVVNEVADLAVQQSGTAGGKPLTRRAFSLLDQDSVIVKQKEVSNLQKVLVIGKISQAAVVAASAYRNQDTFRRQTGIINSRLIDDKLHRNTKVHVGWLEGGTAVFAFRGTASAQDGMQDVKIFSKNIDYLQELYPGVKAHTGFLQQFGSVCHPDRADTNIAAVLKEVSGGHTPTRVICCGHSLGGALATLGAAWAALEYPDADIRCITFGSPRVANKVFGKAFSALVGTSLRLVHGYDPVPSLPPSLMYHHVPGSIHIRKEHILLQHRPWHTLLNPSVADHGMSKYHMGIYRHMPGGLDAMPWLWRHRPSKMLQKAAKAKQRSVATTNVTPGHNSAALSSEEVNDGRHRSYWPQICWGTDVAKG